MRRTRASPAWWPRASPCPTLRTSSPPCNVVPVLEGADEGSLPKGDRPAPGGAGAGRLTPGQPTKD
jgi:hypothetical protein